MRTVAINFAKLDVFCLAPITKQVSMTSFLLQYDECKHKSIANPLSHEADYAVWLNDE